MSKLKRELRARSKQLGFFAAIVFRTAPHGCGLMWPGQAWQCAEGIYDYWMSVRGK